MGWDGVCCILDLLEREGKRGEEEGDERLEG